MLSYSDLLLSVAVAQWSEYDAREEIHQLVDDLNKIGNGFEFSKDWVLKAGLMLGDIGSVGFKVENFNRHNMAILEREWPRIKRSLALTVQLASDFGFKAETLGADSALLPIAYYLYVTGADEGIPDEVAVGRRPGQHTAVVSLRVAEGGDLGERAGFRF